MNRQILNAKVYNDTTLWQSIMAGDEKSFSLLFEKYYADLISYGNSLLPHNGKVQDCVQDVFTDIWVYRDKLNKEVIVKAYLLASVRKRIARLYERDHIFRKTTSTDSLKFIFDFSIEYQLIEDETTSKKVIYLNKLLNDLPTRQKEALYLKYHQGLDIEQISVLLEVNYQSASNLIYRGLVSLRKDWKGGLEAIFLLCLTIF